jgi:putative membrane protein
MNKKFISIFLAGFSFIILDVDGWHMMDWDHHMMDWWGIPYMGFWWIGVWIIQFVIAFFVYKNAENGEKNGLLWFVLVILPWIGLLFLIGYLVIRGEKTTTMEAISNADKVIDERYAKGEITREEYLEIKNDMKKMRNKNGSE